MGSRDPEQGEHRRHRVCFTAAGTDLAQLHQWCRENLGEWGPGRWMLAVHLGRGVLVRTWNPEHHALVTLTWG